MTDLAGDIAEEETPATEPDDDAPVAEEPTPDHADVERIMVDGVEVVLVGTAHISQESVDTVRRVIEEEKPERVCVELDARRYEALSNPKWWESLDLFQVFKTRQVPLLIAQLILGSQQKRMGMATQVKPGAELAAAVEVAKEMGLEFDLIDREIRTTLLRAWRKTSFWKKSSLAASLMASFFVGEEQELNEEAMRDLRQRDALSGMLEEMGDAQPAIKRVLVDERDAFMAQRIREAAKNEGTEKLVAIVGAAHGPGISRILRGEAEPSASVDELSVIPNKSLFSRMVPWLIPTIVVTLFVVGFFYGDTEKVKEAAVAWVLANGVLAALGALLAGGHPLTILAGFVAAPITSLNPTIGAGFVTGFVQTWLRPPSVADMENVGDDIMELKGWWKNNLARVFLVFMLSSIGSSIGTFAAFGWLKDLVQF